MYSSEYLPVFVAIHMSDIAEIKYSIKEGHHPDPVKS
jgi:hypothetical protein